MTRDMRPRKRQRCQWGTVSALHDELREIRDLEAAAEVQVQMSVQTFESIRQRRIRLEAIYGNEKDERRRGILIVGPWGIAAAGIAVAQRWVRGNARSIAAFGGGAAVGVVIGLGAGLPTGGQPPDQPSLAEPAPPALPPFGHNPPRIGPPKSGPPGPVRTKPQPNPAAPGPSQSGPQSSVPPGSSPTPAGPTPTPADPPTDPPTDPPSTGEPDGDEPTCRVYLPRVLNRGILCGPWVR